jgi:hypothetical protein
MLAIVLLANNTIENMLEPFASSQARCRCGPLPVMVSRASSMPFSSIRRQ